MRTTFEYQTKLFNTKNGGMRTTVLCIIRVAFGGMRTTGIYVCHIYGIYSEFKDDRVQA